MIFPLDKMVAEESYLQAISLLDINIIHLKQDFKLPFWTFHLNGGYPFINQPESLALSPLFFILILPFDSAIGAKIFLLFSYSIGVFGFFLFVRRILKFNLTVSAITTMFFSFSSFIAYQINTGNLRDQSWFYLPLITYTLFISKEKPRYLFYCAGLLTLVVLNGFSLYFPIMVLFLFLLAILESIPKKIKKGFFKGYWKHIKKSLIIKLFIILIIVFFLGAVKFLPTLDLLRINSREITTYAEATAKSMTINKMFLAFFSKGPYADGNEHLMGDNGLDVGSVMYFGPIPIVLFLLSCIFCFKKAWKFILLTSIFLLLCMGDNSPIDLFYILWHIPLFSSMHEIPRYFSFPVVFMISSVSGMIFSSKMFKNMNGFWKGFIYIVAIIAAINMFYANIQYHKFTGQAQEINIPELNYNNEFFNVQRATFLDSKYKTKDFYDPNQDWTVLYGSYADEINYCIQYYLIRQNIGLINWYSGGINIDSAASPKYFVLDYYGNYLDGLRKNISKSNGIVKGEKYKGEAYFSKHDENKVNKIEWKTNKIIIHVDQQTPDQLIINQNYYKDWKSNVGKLEEYNGLLSVKLEGNNEEIILSFKPIAFYIGLIMSLITLIFCLIYIFKINKRGYKKFTFRGRKPFKPPSY